MLTDPAVRDDVELVDDHPDILSSLPHRRPHRRSEKRGPRAASASAPPPAAPPAPPQRKPLRPTGRDIVETTVHVAGELAEIALTVTTRALRNSLQRLHRL